VSQQSATYYISVLERGENWDASRPMRQQEQWQEQWQEQLAFLAALSDDGLILGAVHWVRTRSDSSSSLPLKTSTQSRRGSLTLRGRGWGCGAPQRSSGGKSPWARASSKLCGS
jgi:hypothetical protein